MVRNLNNRADSVHGTERPSLPEEAEHVIVAGRSFGAPAPEGYPDADRLRYEKGDELPFDVGEKAIWSHQKSLAALNEEGDIVEGGKADNVLAAISKWKSGDAFDPSEYE